MELVAHILVGRCATNGAGKTGNFFCDSEAWFSAGGAISFHSLQKIHARFFDREHSSRVPVGPQVAFNKNPTLCCKRNRLVEGAAEAFEIPGVLENSRVVLVVRP